MQEKEAASPRVAWVRVLLLVAFGALAAMALTRPGQWVASNVFSPRYALAFTTLPPRLVVATGSASRQVEASRLFLDMRNEGEHAAGSRPVPAPAEVAARLSHLEGWSRAVLFELGSEAADLNAAGVTDRTLCARIASSFARPSPSARAALRSSPIRTWILLLLDGQDRQVAAVPASAPRPAAQQVDPEQRSVVEESSASDEGELPAISLYRRSSTGEVTRG